MALPVALSRGQYLALFAAGGRSIDTVVTLSPDALENCVGRAAAKTIREIGQETAVASRPEQACGASTPRTRLRP
jgi:helicase